MPETTTLVLEASQGSCRPEHPGGAATSGGSPPAPRCRHAPLYLRGRPLEAPWKCSLTFLDLSLGPNVGTFCGVLIFGFAPPPALQTFTKRAPEDDKLGRNAREQAVQAPDEEAGGAEEERSPAGR
jgi:hypothetical protein